MKRFILMLLIGCFYIVVQARTEENKVFDVVDQMPSFPGGSSSLMKYLSSQIKYPVVAEENGVEGKVVCSFVVGTDGSITDVRVVRSVDPSLDKEAVRVLRSMPKWEPGLKNGKTVRVRYTVPVAFRLRAIDNSATNQQGENCFDNIDAVCDDDSVYIKADVVPSFPGGEAEFRNIMLRTIIYPEMAENLDIDGVVQMKFVVGKDGTISNAVPHNSIVTTYGNNEGDVSKTCNSLFVGAVKKGLEKTSRFSPAIVDGKPVKFRMMLMAVFGAGKNATIA